MIDQIPMGATPLKLACVRCGQIVHSWTEADMRNDVEAEIVEKMANSFVCDKCHRNARGTGPSAPWEQSRFL